MAQSREQIEQDLLDYVEGRLPPDAHARVEIYLANTDPKLARQVAGMIEDRQAMQSLPLLTPPADLADRIMSSVERQSLIGGVERQLTSEPRRWFQTRMAIAAGLILVVGGFSFVVLKNLWHPASPLQDWATNSPKETQVASNDSTKDPTGADVAPAHLDRNSDLSDASKKQDSAALAPAAPRVGSAPVPATVAADNDTQIKEQVTEGRLLALGNLDVQHAGYQQAASPQDALAAVRARSRDAADTSTIVITLVSRDAQDVSRLEALLTTYADQADGHKAASTTQPQAEVTGGGGFGGGGRGGSRGGGGAGGAAAAADGPAATAKPPAAQLPGGPAATKMLDRRINNMATPDTYHVLLRPDQLDQISQSFVISSVARGPVAYSVANNTLVVPPTNDANQNNSLAQNSQTNQNGLEQSNSANLVPRAMRNMSIQNQQSYTANGGVLSNGNMDNSHGANDIGKSAIPGTSSLNGNTTFNNVGTPSTAPSLEKMGETKQNSAQVKDSPPWIDCVITIVPAPAPAFTSPARN